MYWGLFISFLVLSFRELADLHKANATKDSEAQEAALSREMKAKEELGLALEKAQEEARQQQEALAIQVGLNSVINSVIQQVTALSCCVHLIQWTRWNSFLCT